MTPVVSHTVVLPSKVCFNVITPKAHYNAQADVTFFTSGAVYAYLCCALNRHNTAIAFFFGGGDDQWLFLLASMKFNFALA
jgi:hypothetical protein